MTSGGRDIDVNIGNLSVVVGSEATLDDLAAHLAGMGATCDAVPADWRGRKIGELVATASGKERDAVRHNLLGIGVDLPDEDARASFGSENMKDVAGYDTKRLFIGGLGNFGAIKDLTFKIRVRT